MFATVRLCLFFAYLYFEVRKYSLHSYMSVNWINIQARKKDSMPDRATKDKLRSIQAWNGVVMLLYSIQIVMFCQCLRCFGQICNHFMCLNFGLIEHIASFQLILFNMLPIIPLFVDLLYLLMQRVNPAHLYDLVEAKLKKMESQHSFEVK